MGERVRSGGRPAVRRSPIHRQAYHRLPVATHLAEWSHTLAALLASLGPPSEIVTVVVVDEKKETRFTRECSGDTFEMEHWTVD